MSRGGVRGGTSTMKERHSFHMPEGKRFLATTCDYVMTAPTCLACHCSGALMITNSPELNSRGSPLLTQPSIRHHPQELSVILSTEHIEIDNTPNISKSVHVFDHLVSELVVVFALEEVVERGSELARAPAHTSHLAPSTQDQPEAAAATAFGQQQQTAQHRQ